MSQHTSPQHPEPDITDQRPPRSIGSIVAVLALGATVAVVGVGGSSEASPAPSGRQRCVTVDGGLLAGTYCLPASLLR